MQIYLSFESKLYTSHGFLCSVNLMDDTGHSLILVLFGRYQFSVHLYLKRLAEIKALAPRLRGPVFDSRIASYV